MKRVLIVENSDAVRAIFDEALADEGYEVRAAADATDALHLAQTSPPDVVVLDLMMPVMNGWSLCERLRVALGHSIPLIVITPTLGAAEIAERLGASAYLTKPYVLDDLLHLIAQLAWQPR
ncbi:MAG: response regulator [Chloroflexi bacterium]|nr:response regulator [Chloroflexota bacterium]